MSLKLFSFLFLVIVLPHLCKTSDSISIIIGYGNINPVYLKTSLQFYRSSEFIKSIHIDKEFKIELIIAPYGSVYEDNHYYYEDIIHNILTTKNDINEYNYQND